MVFPYSAHCSTVNAIKHRVGLGNMQLGCFCAVRWKTARSRALEAMLSEAVE